MEFKLKMVVERHKTEIQKIKKLQIRCTGAARPDTDRI